MQRRGVNVFVRKGQAWLERHRPLASRSSLPRRWSRRTPEIDEEHVASKVVEDLQLAQIERLRRGIARKDEDQIPRTTDR
jgi:hypothetical protein